MSQQVSEKFNWWTGTLTFRCHEDGVEYLFQKTYFSALTLRTNEWQDIKLILLALEVNPAMVPTNPNIRGSVIADRGEIRGHSREELPAYPLLLEEMISSVDLAPVKRHARQISLEADISK